MKKFKTYWKRFLFWIGATVLTLSAIACAKPAEPAEPAMQLDMVQMLETAAQPAEEGGNALRGRLGAPERLQFSTEEGKLSIRADAEVFVPDVSHMPVYRVEAANFTQEQATAFWSALVGDKPMVHQRGRDEYTREEVERNISRIQKQLLELPDNEMRFQTDLSPEKWLKAQEASLNEELARYAAILPGAPEKWVPQPADATLRRMEAYGVNDAGIVGYYDGVNAYQDGVCTFEVENNPVYTKEYGPRNGAKLEYGSNGLVTIHYGYAENAVSVDETTVLDDALLNKLGYTPAQAKQLVETLLVGTGTPFTVREMWLLDYNGSMVVEEGLPRPDEHLAYQIACQRVVGGAACATDFSSAYDTEGGDPIHWAEWDYETLEMMVDNTGIACLRWRSPYSVGEELVEASELLPFSEIEAIFEQLMRVKWLPQTEGIARLTLHVTDVRLELMRIRDANSWSSGMLIPVWNFFGIRERTFHEDFDGETDQTIRMPLLTVNAIDGSIIDPYKGY